MNNKKNKNLKIKCPKCKKVFKYYDSEFRPFCTEKCKMIDLGKWMSEEYSISSPIDTDVEDSDIDDTDC